MHLEKIVDKKMKSPATKGPLNEETYEETLDEAQEAEAIQVFFLSFPRT